MFRSTTLPAWRTVLVVVAHPDDESFGLGALIDRFVQQGAEVDLLCLTQGEASTLGADLGDLAPIRAAELREAGTLLGVRNAWLRQWPDGALASVADDARADVDWALDQSRPNGVLTLDPSGITGHDDHRAATALALSAATARDLPVLGWTIPESVAHALSKEFGVEFLGHREDDCHLTIEVDRTTQRKAVMAHASQAVPGSVLWRRLDLCGEREVLRWLTDPEPTTTMEATR
ncbi:PIG-L deacetylase family protein [Aestuariimicrobium ganziense]|uniref:PIG-L deacetylase family protein n=1 Tax=Aestuariimicrobium ganziense TaxID=2773677 RepID=UPI001940530E|nr:PIG-L family deacetylase [Aestuariimicrobium ganziense]